MNPREVFERAVPGAFFLDQSEPDALEQFLHGVGWVGEAEHVRRVESAGEGNMNCALRVTTDTTSVILKQSRPWVEKYPQIAAPADRALREGAFYQIVAGTPGVADAMPRLLGLDRSSRLLMLEDLGPTADYTWLYEGRPLASDDLTALLDYLGRLHRGFRGSPRAGEFTNREMRALNHAHIFEIPLSGQGPDLDVLTPGLQAVADDLRRDEAFVERVTALGRLYLDDGPALLHGDFFPGSWVRAEGRLRVIDPEFSFFGPPEFDVGVLVAHLILAGQSSETLEVVAARFRDEPDFRSDLAGQLAGVEIMRRLLGVAQLPLSASLEQKRTWVTRARGLVLGTTGWADDHAG